MIFYRESAYVQDIIKSIEEGEKSMPTKYTMTDKDYQQTSQEETINDEIDRVTPEDQQRKTPVQLMSTVSSLMINKIAKKFKSLEETKQHMAKEAESNKRTNARESSEEDEDDDL